MICLQCGYCCKNYLVAIVNDPKLGIIESNIIIKPENTCPHLEKFDDKYICKIHEYEWYKETPCFDHSQIENINEECRIGKYLINKNK